MTKAQRRCMGLALLFMDSQKKDKLLMDIIDRLDLVETRAEKAGLGRCSHLNKQIYKSLHRTPAAMLAEARTPLGRLSLRLVEQTPDAPKYPMPKEYKEVRRRGDNCLPEPYTNQSHASSVTPARQRALLGSLSKLRPHRCVSRM